MKKLFAVAVVVLACAGISFAGEATPARISLFPPLSAPSLKTVHGLDLGIFATEVDEVQGLQLCLIYASAEKKMVGVQYGAIANISKDDAKGVQLGFYNSAKNMTGLQLGFINVADSLKGLQVGLVNIINTGAPLKFMVIANAHF